MSFIKKSFGEFVTVIVLALFILIIYYSIAYDDKTIISNEYFSSSSQPPITWGRNKCNYILGDTYEDELNKHGIIKSDTNCNLYFPCGYDEIQKEINEMPIYDNAKYFIIDSCDEMVAKEWLWKNVRNHYGLTIARTLLPNSFILYDNKDLIRFDQEYDPAKIYIMKKNIQRQEGLKITKNKTDIVNGFKNGYVVVQELLQDPYLISGRKTNMRFYVLVLCKEKQLTVFVHNDGFMYYTRTQFVPNTIETDPNVTTGYIERQVYKENPLTHDDLREYLDNPNRELLEVERNIRTQGLKISQVYFNRIYHGLRDVFISFVGKICQSKKLSNNLSFQLFGVDIAVNNEMQVKIIEINKGPDMGAKDERDSALKHGVVQDIFKLTDTINTPNLPKPKFIKILDIGDGIINNTDL